MGEALIVSRGSSSGGSSGKTLISQIFIENTIWKAPKIPDQNFSVRIFGGGGGSSNYGGGGGGYMNNAILKINAGEEIAITIGVGGKPYTTTGDNGGTTSFGTYLSALGGSGGNGQNGGNGGAGGGGLTIGGTGFQFGGGGPDGNGGKWGGGGGSGKGGCLYENSQNIYEITGYSGLGGNGSTDVYNNNGGNGINTIGIGLEFEGTGLGGIPDFYDYGDDAKGAISGACGGGGYGGCGGKIYHYGVNGRSYYNYYRACSGGGGYGANGGGACEGSGGGGGYGGDGGDSNSSSSGHRMYGGGGGYGKLGTGGGYDNREMKLDGGIAAGGAAFYNANGLGSGGNGICIIQYYI